METYFFGGEKKPIYQVYEKTSTGGDVKINMSQLWRDLWYCCFTMRRVGAELYFVKMASYYVEKKSEKFCFVLPLTSKPHFSTCRTTSVEQIIHFLEATWIMSGQIIYEAVSFFRSISAEQDTHQYSRNVLYTDKSAFSGLSIGFNKVKFGLNT